MDDSEHPLSTDELDRLVELMRHQGPWGAVVKFGQNKSMKAEFKDLATKLLKGLAKALDLPKDSFDVRFNAGGSAVSGEATLHAERIYVQLGHHQGLGLLYRACRGRDDYAGLTNQWWKYEDLANWEGFVDATRRTMWHGEAPAVSA